MKKHFLFVNHVLDLSLSCKRIRFIYSFLFQFCVSIDFDILSCELSFFFSIFCISIIGFWKFCVVLFLLFLKKKKKKQFNTIIQFLLNFLSCNFLFILTKTKKNFSLNFLLFSYRKFPTLLLYANYLHGESACTHACLLIRETLFEFHSFRST